MLYIILIIISIGIGGYFALRYISLLFAFKKITAEINDIQQDLSQNQILHLPVPNHHLAKVIDAFNGTLEEIRSERLKYGKREREFQKQIENISHDLRTPLTVILGYLKLIKSNDIISHQETELRENLEIIEKKAEIMRTLVSQFYEYSRLNAGDYELTLHDVDISRALRESLMGNYQVLEQSHLDVTIDVPEHPIWIIGEDASLERIFLNLFQNAGRYADTRLHISAKENQDTARITFTNDTTALSEADIPYLFERFYMQDNSRGQGGTGLGLTVARSLAEEMGGTLNAYFAGEGSICFELCVNKAKKEK